MRVSLSGIVMCALACQNIDPESQTQGSSVAPPAIDMTKVTPTAVVVEVGSPSQFNQAVTSYAYADPTCCPVAFAANSVLYAGTALSEKWFVDLTFDTTANIYTQPSGELKLTPIANTPGTWTDSSSGPPFVVDVDPQSPTPLAPGPHTIQVFIGSAFADLPESSGSPPWAVVDGGQLTSFSWVIDEGTCSTSCSTQP